MAANDNPNLINLLKGKDDQIDLPDGYDYVRKNKDEFLLKNEEKAFY